MKALRVPKWYLVVIGAVAVQRLGELAISRSNEAGIRGVRAASSTYPLMVLAHVGLVTLPLVEVALRGSARRPRWPWVALLAGATCLRYWSIRSLGRSWNVRATVPDNLRPVETGPYAYIRHPNYLAVILEFAALPLMAGAWRSAVSLSVLNALVLVDRIRAEEMLLDASPAYRHAFARRHRFIPGVF